MTSENYKEVERGLSPVQISFVISAFERCRDYELNDYSFVIIKGTDIEVGYIGDSTLELFDSDNSELKEHHDKITSIYEAALEEFDRDKTVKFPIRDKGRGKHLTDLLPHRFLH